VSVLAIRSKKDFITAAERRWGVVEGVDDDASMLVVSSI